MRVDIIIILLFSLTCIYIIYEVSALNMNFDTIIDNLEKYNLLDKIGSLNKHEVLGLYSPVDKVYCVWPEARSPKAVSETEAHEYCHYLVDINYEHFCK
jgi:hypothetical protein